MIYDLQNNDFINDNNHIVISENEIDRLISLWEKKRQRLPTQIELKGLIEQQIREEVMYREALLMGMDKNDLVIRRRLAQKIEFISSDIAALIKPTDKELTEFLKLHAEKFKTPAQLDFEHIYFSDDKRAKKAQSDALSLLNKLKQSNKIIDTQYMGDVFMMDHQYNKITSFGISKVFGQAFANKLFLLKTDSWQGPVKSEYGFHLVNIKHKINDQPAELNTVRDKVLYEWQAEQRKKMDKLFYQKLRQRYEIIIENIAYKMDAASVKS